MFVVSVRAHSAGRSTQIFYFGKDAYFQIPNTIVLTYSSKSPAFKTLLKVQKYQHQNTLNVPNIKVLIML